jgi:hypothetical protein
MNSNPQREQPLRDALQTSADEYRLILPELASATAGPALERLLRRIIDGEARVRTAHRRWASTEAAPSAELQGAVARYAEQLSRLIAAVEACRRQCATQRECLRPEVASAVRRHGALRAYGAPDRR